MDDDLAIKVVLKSENHDGESREYICTNTRLGKGAYSKVYRGYLKSSAGVDEREYVAIKKMSLEQLRAHDCLENEIDIMRRLDHPNILKLLDVIEMNEKGSKVLYMVLELCDGGDLKNLVRKRRMKEKYAIVYFRQIAEGLQYLRSKNIIHRDLKPHNVLLSKDRKVLKIADFGFAKIIGSDALAETLCGSPLYMAPEILLKRPYTSKADLWSVGVMLYEVLCGCHPFRDVGSIVDLVHKAETSSIHFPSTVNISVPGIDLLKRLLKKDSHHRISWSEFFEHVWFKLGTRLERSESRLSESSSMITNIKHSSPMSIKHSSPMPIIMDYSINNRCDMAMSPPSFMNSPTVPIQPFALNIIDNYESESSKHMESMPVLYGSNSERSSSSYRKSKKAASTAAGSVSDYLGTSLKMLRESFKNQHLH